MRPIVVKSIIGIAAIIVLIFCFRGIFSSRVSIDPNKSTQLSWKILSLMDPDTGEAPPIVMRLNDAHIRMAGYMVPLDDDAREIHEFLLVPYEGACIHVPPPPPNQMVYVKMKSAPVEYEAGAIWISGTLHLTPTQSPYGKVTYEVAADSVEKFTGDEREKSHSGLEL